MIISKILSKIKKSPYTIDEAIPTSYILSEFMSRIMMLWRGFFVFCKKDGFLFVGRKEINK
jgi:hypothetical protein